MHISTRRVRGNAKMRIGFLGYSHSSDGVRAGEFDCTGAIESAHRAGPARARATRGSREGSVIDLGAPGELFGGHFGTFRAPKMVLRIDLFLFFDLQVLKSCSRK